MLSRFETHRLDVQSYLFHELLLLLSQCLGTVTILGVFGLQF